MKKKKKALIPIAILLISVLVGSICYVNRPQAVWRPMVMVDGTVYLANLLPKDIHASGTKIIYAGRVLSIAPDTEPVTEDFQANREYLLNAPIYWVEEKNSLTVLIYRDGKWWEYESYPEKES